MYRIAVCEDEPIFLKYISEMTVDILSSIGESCEIWKYTGIGECVAGGFWCL